MKTKIIAFFLLFCTANNIFAQDTFGEIFETDYYLGFRVVPNFSNVGQFAILYIPGNVIKEVQTISLSTFMNYASGNIKNDANPEKLNFFTEYGIEDTTIVADIWKLRYKKYPYKSATADAGWSNNDSIPSAPADGQLLILQTYGVKKISDFFYGEDAFRLLKDMQNATWVDTYKSAH